ncbi:protein of unknown function precursor [Patiriisocius marinistellae]|uniref:DUF3078 domain-containing protein n=1 Tax=Patiriisocius marinistellae TaxID=2494560 RepID=A0A5J4FUL8_9FLAO|nr:DUF3078 domain-containing protein [Patiriisocius marinistellae]GEQ84702.1 protein of unknown function precursor [Patiriisocius marinistellae]
MKKILLTLAIAAIPYLMVAQDEAEAPKEGWTKAGNVSLLFSQSAFNAEWQGGGTTNYSVNLTGSYDANYKKGRLTWDNRLMVDYGITNQRDQEFSKKTNDRLEFNSIVGKQLSDTSKWYYSFFFNFRSQITSGYTFGEDVDGNETRTEQTKFLSPGYFQAGPGMLWKDSDNLKVNIAPATARLIVVDSKFTEVDANDPVALAAYSPYFGVDANESTRFEFGASIGAYGKFTLLENVSMENVLNLYSNYLEDPQNVDIDYTMNLVMTVNKWITANTTFQAIYDDNAVKGFQIREALAIGVTYGF